MLSALLALPARPGALAPQAVWVVSATKVHRAIRVRQVPPVRLEAQVLPVVRGRPETRGQQEALALQAVPVQPEEPVPLEALARRAVRVRPETQGRQEVQDPQVARVQPEERVRLEARGQRAAPEPLVAQAPLAASALLVLMARRAVWVRPEVLAGRVQPVRKAKLEALARRVSRGRPA